MQLILVCGLPLTGKTFFSKALAKKINAIHLNSDSIRRKLLKKASYSRKEKFFVYNKMFSLAAKNLKKKNVILDATFYKEILRRKAKRIAINLNASFYLIELKAKEKTVKSFALIRSKSKSESEADLNVFFKLKKEFEPIKEKHLVIEAELPLEKQLNKALNFIKPFIELYHDSFKEKTDLIETHISWILLTKKFAYKIKKPVKFSFLDFSSLKKRKFYCFKELKLNSRTAKNVYLAVMPIKKFNDKIFSGKSKGKTIDFVLKMKRLPEKRKMSFLLKKNKVRKKDIKILAKTIALFHRKAKKIRKGFYALPSLLQKQINDLNSVKEIIQKNLGKNYVKKIDFILRKSNKFIKENKELLIERKNKGFVRECHGDLHSGNIFLMKKPIIFDCIEFNESFSFIDVASDLAFLAMDLDSFNKRNLSNLLVKEYLKETIDEMLEFLLPFFKCYRANVRAKVNAFQLLNAKTKNERKKIKKEIIKYLNLAERYAVLL